MVDLQTKYKSKWILWPTDAYTEAFDTSTVEHVYPHTYHSNIYPRFNHFWAQTRDLKQQRKSRVLA